MYSYGKAHDLCRAEFLKRWDPRSYAAASHTHHTACTLLVVRTVVQTRVRMCLGSRLAWGGHRSYFSNFCARERIRIFALPQSDLSRSLTVAEYSTAARSGPQDERMCVKITDYGCVTIFVGGAFIDVPVSLGGSEIMVAEDSPCFCVSLAAAPSHRPVGRWPRLELSQRVMLSTTGASTEASSEAEAQLLLSDLASPEADSCSA